MEMLNECFSGIPLPPKFGGGDPVDKACTFWSGLLVPHMCAESGRMSEQGRQMFTALLCASPSGIPIAKAFQHKIQVWRESPDGMETVEAFERLNDSVIVMVDIRDVVSGKTRDGDPLLPQQDMMCTICDMVNVSELEQEQFLDDVEEVSSGGEGSNASVNSGGSQREVPHSQYTVEQRLDGVDAAEM